MNTFVSRPAGPEDIPWLAEMNQQLIQDEGHRNPMDIEQLTRRMRQFLEGDYQAVIFEQPDLVGYALYRYEPEYVYLRQFFIAPPFRRKGYGRHGMEQLLAKFWGEQKHLRLEVLVHNTAGLAFWQSLGLAKYSLTLEMTISS